MLWWASWLPGYSNAQTAADLDPAQVYNTGNVVVPTTTTSGSTWVNGVYQDQLGCFGGGGGGYCGPNPMVRPTGDINFSYGWADLYQVRQIADVLPYSGTGLRINGYNLGFTAKNGNGWDDGRVDLLYAYVQLDGPNGTVFNDTANISYNYNWTRFNLAKTFTDPYNTTDITSVRYGFVGKDNNYWAGPYGPEIRDVSFSLSYSVDPCVSDPLFSPSCPGYLEALARLIPAATPVAEPVTESAVAEPVSTPVAIAATQPSDQSSKSAESAAPAQEQKQDQNQDKKGASLSTILGIVGREQSRISALEQSVVSESVSQSTKDADRAAAEAEAVAQQSSSQSQEQTAGNDASSMSQSGGTQSDAQSSAQGSAVSAASLAARSGPATTSMDSSTDSVISTITEVPAPPVQSTAQTQTLPAVAAGAVELRGPVPVTTATDMLDSAVSTTDGYLGRGLIIDVPLAPIIVSVESVIAAPKMDPGVLLPTSTAEDTVIIVPMMPRPDPVVEVDMPAPSTVPVAATTPADDWMEPRAILPDSQNTSAQTDTRRHSAANDLALGVDISSLATQPLGYAQYNVALKDAEFYAPKEIYKGQKVVDNARALRQLSSDARHQEMVEQQYKR